MKAETAYNVIQALPVEELNRLFKMLNVVSEEKKEEQKNTKSITNADAVEYLLKMHHKKLKRYRK